MRKRKIAIDEEPVWKVRRKEAHVQARRSRLWVVLGVAAGIAVLGLYTTFVVRGLQPRARKSAKTQIEHTISHVVDKKTVTKDGKIERHVSFSIGPYMVDKKVTERQYRTLKKDQTWFVSYETDPDTRLLRVVKWEPLKQGRGEMKSEK